MQPSDKMHCTIYIEHRKNVKKTTNSIPAQLDLHGASHFFPFGCNWIQPMRALLSRHYSEAYRSIPLRQMKKFHGPACAQAGSSIHFWKYMRYFSKPYIGFSIGLGMASHGQVPMTYSGAGHVAQPLNKTQQPI